MTKEQRKQARKDRMFYRDMQEAKILLDLAIRKVIDINEFDTDIEKLLDYMRSEK